MFVNWETQESSTFRRGKDVGSFGNGEFQVSGVSRWKCFPSSWLTQLWRPGERRKGERERKEAERERGREEGTAGVNNLRKVIFQGNIVLEAVTKSLEPFECYFSSCKV